MRYSTAQASDLTGLSVRTIRDYIQSGRSSLKRNSDFYVKHRLVYGPRVQRSFYRRYCFFTEQGIRRLIIGDYRVFGHGSRIRRKPPFGVSPLPSTLSGITPKTP